MSSLVGITFRNSFLANPEHIKEYVRGQGGIIIPSNKKKLKCHAGKKDLLITRMKEYYKF